MEDFDEVSEGIIGCLYLILNKEEKKKTRMLRKKNDIRVLRKKKWEKVMRKRNEGNM